MPFQRRHALAGLHVPHLEHSWRIIMIMPITRHDAPPVRRDGNTISLQRRHIITKVPQKADAARRTWSECPTSVATHLPVSTSHTLSTPDPQISGPSQETTRRPSGNTATPLTYDEDTSSQRYSGRCAPHQIRALLQRRHAFAGRHIPNLDHSKTGDPTPRHDAPPVRKHGNVIDLRRRQCHKSTTKS